MVTQRVRNLSNPYRKSLRSAYEAYLGRKPTKSSLQDREQIVDRSVTSPPEISTPEPPSLVSPDFLPGRSLELPIFREPEPTIDVNLLFRIHNPAEVDFLRTFQGVEAQTWQSSSEASTAPEGQLPIQRVSTPELMWRLVEIDEELNETIKLDFQLPVPAVPANVNIPMSITLAAEDQSASPIRMSLDSVFVIDQSASMGEFSRLELVQRTLCFLSDVLTPNDRVGIVPFDHQVRDTFELTPMTSENKPRFLHYVSRLTAFGGTNIEAGLKAGFDLLGRRTDRREHTSIFFLSDGFDEGHNAQERVLKVISENQHLTDSGYVFGIGSDHDTDLCESMARTLKGRYFSIPSAENIVQALSDSVAYLGTLRSKEIYVNIAPNENSEVPCRIVRVHNDSNSRSFPMPPLSSSGNQKFSFEIEVDSHATSLSVVKPVRIKITYRGARTNEQLEEIIEPEVNLDNGMTSQPQDFSNLRGVVELYKNLGSNAIKKIIQSADVRRWDEARRIASKTIQELCSCIAANNTEIQQIIDLLRAAEDQLVDEDTWNRARSDLVERRNEYYSEYDEDFQTNTLVEEIREKARTTTWLTESWQQLQSEIESCLM